jgi:hypothetical protein
MRREYCRTMFGRALLVTFLSLVAHGTQAATITVTNTNNSGPGSLRAALASVANGDTINLAVTGTVLLTSGHLVVSNNVTIIGPGPANLAINGNVDRVFDILSNKVVTISSLTITNGSGDLGGGIYNNQSTLTVSNCWITGNSAPGAGGGGIYSNGTSSNATLKVINSVVSGNSASGGGGGIFSDGENSNATLTVVNCIVSGNSAALGAGIFNAGYDGSATAVIGNSIITGNAADTGGGIYNGSAIMTISNSTISGNVGGGIDNDGFANGSATMTISNSTISGNSSNSLDGAGIYNDGGSFGSARVTIANSTISGNIAVGFGAGVLNTGCCNGSNATATIVNSTFSGNSADSGGADIFNDASLAGNAVLVIGNTILNSGASVNSISNDSGTVTSLGYNLSNDGAGGLLHATGDKTNSIPLLGPLQDNGGPTFTHALLPGSPAIDAGNPNFAPPPDFDQRGPGFPRVVNGRIDIGAFEFTPDLLITAAQRIGNNLRLTFGIALLGKTYEIQARTNLTAGGWLSLSGNLSGNGGTLQTTVTNAFTAPQQFFRVHQFP